MDRQANKVRPRFLSVGSAERIYDVVRDGVVIDTFEDEAMAHALADFRNARTPHPTGDRT